MRRRKSIMVVLAVLLTLAAMVGCSTLLGGMSEKRIERLKNMLAQVNAASAMLGEQFTYMQELSAEVELLLADPELSTDDTIELARDLAEIRADLEELADIKARVDNVLQLLEKRVEAVQNGEPDNLVEEVKLIREVLAIIRIIEDY